LDSGKRYIAKAVAFWTDLSKLCRYRWKIDYEKSDDWLAVLTDLRLLQAKFDYGPLRSWSKFESVLPTLTRFLGTLGNLKGIPTWVRYLGMKIYNKF
jgi:hypothetical protein